MIFDPTAALKLGSPMDDLPVIESHAKEVAAKPAAFSIFLEPTIGPEETNEVTFGPSNERSVERKKVRHTFDILADQLLALREIAIEREKAFWSESTLGGVGARSLRFVHSEGTKQNINERSNEYAESTNYWGLP